IGVDGHGEHALIKGKSDDSFPAWSPDGMRLAFSSTRDGNEDIYIFDLRSRHLSKITRGPALAPTPPWPLTGPDPPSLPVRGGNDDLWVSDLRSGRHWKLSAGDGDVLDPHWNRSGRITFASTRDSQLEIGIATVDGRHKYIAASYANDPSWSPDGHQIAIANDNYDLYTANLAATTEHQLTSSNSSDWAPAWSPTKGQVAFASDRSGSAQIYVVGLRGKHVRRLTRWGGDDPAWSPDGRRIAFDSDRSGHQQLYTMSATGTGERRLPQPGSDDAPAWSPAGRQLAFASDGSGRWAIYVARADGTAARKVTQPAPGDSDSSPTWSPDGRKIAFARDLDYGSGVICVVRVNGHGRVRVIVHDRTPASDPD